MEQLQLVVLLVGIGHNNMAAIQAIVQNQNFSIITATSQNEAYKLIWEHEIALAIIDLQTSCAEENNWRAGMAATQRTKNISLIFINALNKKSFPAAQTAKNQVKYLYTPFNTATASAVIKNCAAQYISQKETEKNCNALAQYTALVNNSPDVICVLQAKDFSVSYINSAAEKLLGFLPEAFSGKPLYAFTKKGESSATYSALHKLIQHAGKTIAFEDDFLNQKTEDVRLSCRAIYKDNEIYINLSKAVSASHISAAEAVGKNDSNEKSKEKDLFLAKVVHEIRTPINGMIDVLNLVKDTKLDNTQQELIDLAAANAETLLGIVNDVLDISKIEEGKFTIHRNKVNLDQLLEGLINLFKFRVEKKGIKFIYEKDKDVPKYIIADALRLKQILMNLLSNAIKFTKYGYVKLCVKALETQVNFTQIQFTIKDTGIGIPANKLNTIFDIYTQAEENTTEKYGGTGLGLNIVKQLAVIKGGELSVSSRISKGSTFSFSNKYEAVAEDNDTAKNKSTEFAPFEKPNILLVEDNELSHIVLQTMLKKWSVQTDHALNGKQAIEMLKHKDYNLILMDTQMPEMNGYEATQAIRKGVVPGKSNIPIISVSAGVSKEEQRLALEAGMNEIVEKPVKASDLYHKISAALKS